MSNFDPTEEILGASSGDPVARLARRVRDLEAQITAMRQRPILSLVTGAPVADAVDGAGAVDTSTMRLWIPVGGAWTQIKAAP